MSADAYWILKRDQVQALASAMRMDIIDHLASAGPQSIKSLARDLGVKPSALYHHINRLLGVGLILEAGTQVENRKSEKLYRTPSPRMRLKQALDESTLDTEVNKVVDAVARQANRDFYNGRNAPAVQTDGKARNLGFYRALNRPSPGNLEKINQKLDEIAELLWDDQDDGQPQISLSWIMAPRE